MLGEPLGDDPWAPFVLTRAGSPPLPRALCFRRCRVRAVATKVRFAPLSPSLLADSFGVCRIIGFARNSKFGRILDVVRKILDQNSLEFSFHFHENLNP